MKRSPIKRHTRMRRVNRKRLAARRAEQFGPQAEWCRTLPCCVCGRKPPSDPHHIVSRGAGGSDRDCVPLCRDCHTEIHTIGRDSFEAKHNVNLRAVAEALHERLEQQK